MAVWNACTHSMPNSLLAPPPMAGQGNWTPSSSRKQFGQISYELGVAPRTRRPQQEHG